MKCSDCDTRVDVIYYKHKRRTGPVCGKCLQKRYLRLNATHGQAKLNRKQQLKAAGTANFTAVQFSDFLDTVSDIFLETEPGDEVRLEIDNRNGKVSFSILAD